MSSDDEPCTHPTTRTESSHEDKGADRFWFETKYCANSKCGAEVSVMAWVEHGVNN